MYMWCVHCVLLDERISSEDIFRGGGNYRCRLCLVWMLKMCSCSSKWQCLCLSESITVLFCSRDVAVVVSGVCASESVSKMWMVYLFVYLHNVIWISLCAKVLCACMYVHVFLCDCVSSFPTAVSLPLGKDWGPIKWCQSWHTQLIWVSSC